MSKLLVPFSPVHSNPFEFILSQFYPSGKGNEKAWERFVSLRER